LFLGKKQIYFALLAFFLLVFLDFLLAFFHETVI